MRIKEVEDILGITSKNIRFYEKEKLLSPKRNLDNGYREYSKDDIDTLKKIKLLRKLGISLEDIRLIQSGTIAFSDLLEKHAYSLKSQINSFDKAKSLCLRMIRSNTQYDELNADIWLSEVKELEKKGVKFMDIDYDEIIRFLPEKFKSQYYESIIKNGQVSTTLLKEIISYFEGIYKKSVNTEQLLVDALKKVDCEERAKLLLLLKQNNTELYNKLSKRIYDFEDIINLDTTIVKNTLEQFDRTAIIKASEVASPKVNEYLQNLFPDVDFTKEKRAIGPLPINEIMNIYSEIIEALNKNLEK